MKRSGRAKRKRQPQNDSRFHYLYFYLLNHLCDKQQVALCIILSFTHTNSVYFHTLCRFGCIIVRSRQRVIFFIYFSGFVDKRHQKTPIYIGGTKLNRGDGCLNKQIAMDEQETIITFSPSKISKEAQIYTCMPGIIKRIRAYAKDRPDSVRITKDEGDAVFATIDKSCVRFAPKRKLSEEQRQAAAERLAKGRAVKI